MFFPVYGIFFDPVLALAIGLIGGFVSGFLGVGCGVVITPLLMEFGIPPLIAVATQLCHAVGTNFLNFLSYRRNQDVDFEMSVYILAGGAIGAACEWAILKYSSDTSLIVHKFALFYVVTLFIFGIIMLYQSLRIHKGYHGSVVMMRRWMVYLPIHKIFKRSRTEMSIFVPIFVGFLAGMIVASLGGGNNLFMAPIITYLIGRISPVVQGTTSLAGFVITIMVALIYSERGYNCDLSFVMILFAGASIGTLIGVYLTYNINRRYIHLVSACVVFLMAIRMFFKLFEGTYKEVFQSSSQDLSRSIIFQFVNGKSMLYTAVCVLFICAVALVSEKFLQKMASRKKFMKRVVGRQ
ncbi:MAG: sulfite exporter TauE/SafE family protein [Holosporales bacterium]|jgi:uncharacterized membrane protein YfcA|nr:sulfite exporter TauE/SafE family protein [Holosporales bacterium]